MLPAAVALAPLALGSVHTWTWMGLLAACALAGAMVALARRREAALANATARVPVPAAAIVAAVAGLLCLAQAVPLPDFVVEALSPAAATQRDLTRAVTGARGVIALSLEPWDTALAGIRLLGLAAVVAAAAMVSADRRRAQLIVTAAAAGGLGTLAAGVVHWATGASLLLGFYDSPDVATVRGAAPSLGFVTTLLNANHAGAMLALTAHVLLGRAIAGRAVAAAPLAGALLAGAGVFATGSRGSVLALVVGVVVLLGARVLPRVRAGSWREMATTALGTLLFAGGAIALLAAFNAVLLSGSGAPLVGDPSDESKVRLWRTVWLVVRDHPVTGIGAGALASVAPAYGGTALSTTPWHAENVLLEAVLDLGLILGPALLAAAVLSAAGVLLGGLLSPRWAGVSAGLCALALHDSADFALSVPGVAIPAAALLGVLAGRRAPAGAGTPGGDGTGARTGLLACILAAFAAVAVAAVVAATGRDLRGEGERLAALCRAGPAGACVDAARDASGRHPLSAGVLLAGAAGNAAAGDLDSAEAWLVRAAERCPGCLNASLSLVDVRLARGRPADAAAACRDLLATRPDATEEVLAHVEASGVSPAAMAALLAGTGAPADRMAARLSDQGRLATAESYLKALIARDGESPERLWALGRLLIRAGRPRDADRVATELIGRFPESSRGWALQALVETAAGRLDHALQMVRAARAIDPADPMLAIDELSALAWLRRFDEFDAAAAAARASAEGRREAMLRYHLVLAERLALEERWSEALSEYDRAERVVPGNAEGGIGRARVFRRMGDVGRAARAYREVLSRHPGDPTATEELGHLDGVTR